MKQFSCECGQRIFFDNLQCTQCNKALGFDPESLSLLTLRAAEDSGYAASSGTRYRLCKNREEYQICNWLISADSPESYCLSCRRNLVVPNLSNSRNLVLWGRLEQAKRRLLYTLLSLHLPLDGIENTPRMAFQFLEDQRANPLVSEELVATGHHEGTITINLAEADDALRHAVKEGMQERYRTLLGHFRHESGHYYFESAVSYDIAGFRAHFGDEQINYEDAIRRYYESKNAHSDWVQSFISQYASAHPFEDWAESWAHYLHIVDTLETAAASGVVQTAGVVGSEGWLATWMDLSITLNELNRSMGTDDAYPFVLSPIVTEKLKFIHRRVERMATAPEASEAH